MLTDRTVATVGRDGCSARVTGQHNLSRRRGNTTPPSGINPPWTHARRVDDVLLSASFTPAQTCAGGSVICAHSDACTVRSLRGRGSDSTRPACQIGQDNKVRPARHFERHTCNRLCRALQYSEDRSLALMPSQSSTEATSRQSSSIARMSSCGATINRVTYLLRRVRISMKPSATCISKRDRKLSPSSPSTPGPKLFSSTA